ncbi:MAG: InlB B-repeat-containing protein, partial [archaeon]|nr:InlB B-repeat-containing protein [archaeon]
MLERLMLVVAAVLAVVLLLSPLSSAEEGQTVEVSLSPTSVPGTVEVYIDGNPGILSLKLSIDYDGSVMRLKEVVAGDVLDITPSNVGKTPYILYGEGSDPNSAVTATGLFATLVFELLDGMDIGQYPVYVTALESIDGDLEDVSVNVVGGVVSSGLPLVGDIDGNGKINALDSLKLKRFLAEDETVTIVGSNSDLNSDGKINSKDSLLLRRYLAGNDIIFSGSTGDSTVTIDQCGTFYTFKGLNLDYPLFVRVYDPFLEVEVSDGGSVEYVGDGLYRILLKTDGSTVSVSEDKGFSVSISVTGSDYGSVDKTVLNVPGGTTWSVSDNILVFSDGQTVTATPAERTSRYVYGFVGWSGQSGTVDSDTGLTAVFERTVRQYAIRFCSEGNVISSAMYGYGSVVERPADPVREGYGFTGWYTDSDCTSLYDFGSTVVKARYLYAGWFEISSFKVLFTVDGEGSISPTSVSVVKGTTWSVSGNVLTFSDGQRVIATANPQTEQYTFSFSSWSKNSGTVTSDECINAVFTPAVRQYTITVYSDTNVSSAGEEDYGTSITAPTAPTKTAHMFTGWYTDQNCSVAAAFPIHLTGDVVLYAGWSKETGKVQFVFGTLPMKRAYPNTFDSNSPYYKAFDIDIEVK